MMLSIYTRVVHDEYMSVKVAERLIGQYVHAQQR
jgi:hypothetical protein